MGNWGLYTPDGVNDVLMNQCYVKRQLESSTRDLFLSYGYKEIETPTIEFFDVFSDAHSISQETMFKFFDENGRILVLRPDITTPIARVMGTKLFDKNVMPLRLCYIGKVFRYDGTSQRSTQREFTQAGIELVGGNNPKADAEVLAITIKTLLNAGLSEFQLEIGQVGFFKGLMDMAKISAEKADKIRKLINKKDVISLEREIESSKMDSYIKELLLGMPTNFGGIEILDKIDVSKLNDQAADAIKNLRLIYQGVENYGLCDFISIDLGMLNDIEYYTGMVFKGVAHGVGAPVCGGGRYDHLIEHFGTKCSATGVAIGVERVLAALYRSKGEIDEVVNDALIYCENGAEKAGINTANSLREKGYKVEMYLDESPFETAKAYAKAKGIRTLLKINADHQTQAFDLKGYSDEEIKSIMGGVEK